MTKIRLKATALGGQAARFCLTQPTRVGLWGPLLSLLSLLPLLSLALLTACGPGTGGTGTGPGPVATTAPQIFRFSTQAMPTDAQPTKAPNAPDAVPLLAPLGPVENSALTISLEQVSFQTRCARFVSSTPLVVAAAGETRLAGSLETQQTSNGRIVIRSAPAQLLLQFSSGKPDSDQVTVWIVDSSGLPLLGPFILLRDASFTDASVTPAPTASVGSCL